jgi:endonuclease YncB( thermonuclease family)
VNNNFYWALLISLLFAQASFSAHAREVLEGRVVGVHDGDTVTLLVNEKNRVKIRLAQIDAPEKAQAFGEQSKQSLSDLVFNKNVRIEKDNVDKHGRTVGTILVNGVDANKEQIKKGMAWVYKQFMHDQSLLGLENDARQAKLGLWSDRNPTPPWKFRREHKIGKVNKLKRIMKKAKGNSPAPSSQ